MKIGKTNLENCKHCGEQIASKFDPNLTFFCQEKQFFAENYLVLKKNIIFSSVYNSYTRTLRRFATILDLLLNIFFYIFLFLTAVNNLIWIPKVFEPIWPFQLSKGAYTPTYIQDKYI